MRLYRLKKEAMPFVLEKHATKIYDLEAWESIGMSLNALEEVKPPYITHGIRTSEHSSTLGGWRNGEGSAFEFTIHFPSTSFFEHDKFSKGKMTRELMDKVQRAISNHYEQFVEE